MDCEIRWMLRNDLSEVMRIENESFENPWSEKDFKRHLRRQDTIGVVAEAGGRVVGYMVYEMHKHRYHIISISACPSSLRQGVGTALIAYLTKRLKNGDRNRINLEVRETNLNAQLFFKAVGFRATEVFKDFYGDCDEDAYAMTYRLPQTDCVLDNN